ncbi:MAG: hypothetical protein ACK40Z_15010, partial [Dietzia sp.]
VGNVYRAEVLFRLGLDPFRPGTRISREQFAAIWDDLAALMPIGVDTGGIVTIRPEHDHGDVPRRGGDRPRNLRLPAGRLGLSGLRRARSRHGDGRAHARLGSELPE